jgi:soluble epoxide hydrolase/lipid-phosphate phosphatase
MAHIAYPAHAHTTTLPSGTTYSYAFSRPTNKKPTILFLHGFPSSSHDWIYQFHHFSSQGYGVLAPDLLGYGETDSPVEAEAYKFSTMATDLMSLMKSLDIKTNDRSVHVIGHDFGSYLMSYLIIKYPKLAKSCVFLAVPFVPPGQKMDLDVMKPVTETLVGFEVFGYRRFLIQERAWEVLDEHVSLVDEEGWAELT